MPSSHLKLSGLAPAPGSDLRNLLRCRIAGLALAQLAASDRMRTGLRGAPAWRAYAAALRGRFARSLSTVPFQRAQKVPARVVSRRDYGGFSVENVLFESLPGWWVNGTVWRPDPRKFPPPWKAVITPVGHNGKYFASEQFPPQVFAGHGLITISFDPPGFGEKRAGNDHFQDGVRCYLGGHNPLAFFVADARRAIDYMLARADVDPTEGVAMTGVSGGGFTSIATAIVDSRVRVIGPSCFGLPDAMHPVRNGYASCPETLWHRRYEQGLGLVDLMVAARFVPMLLMCGRHDSVLTLPVVRELARQAGVGYRGAGVAERLELFVDDCGHEYTVRQARRFVEWVRRWWRLPHPGQDVPSEPRLLPSRALQCNPPAGRTMAAFAAEEAKSLARNRPSIAARRRLSLLVGRDRTRSQPMLRETGAKAGRLWQHALTELTLRDGAIGELPATRVRRFPATGPENLLVYFDDRGRWASLQRWGWLSRAAGLFAAAGPNLSILTVDLPGWGDTAPAPSAFDVVGWGGVDRWMGYVSAATGDSVMAMRVRDACRVIRHVRARGHIRSGGLLVGGHGLGANVAAFAAWLEGLTAGLVLVDPLVSFGDLAGAQEVRWPHDAYFPGILRAADFPAVVRELRAPTFLARPQDARREPATGASLRAFGSRRNLEVWRGPLARGEERLVEWLRRLTG